MGELATAPLPGVATIGHVVSEGTCRAAIVTERLYHGLLRVQYFLPPGAIHPMPGEGHVWDSTGAADGSFHRTSECPRP